MGRVGVCFIPESHWLEPRMRACWLSLSDRRILCDRTLPVCSRCSQSNRTCKGYGVRLSWPKANDKRRAVVARSSLQQSTGHRFSNARLVNISTWDIDMHRHLSGAMDGMNGNAFHYGESMWPTKRGDGYWRTDELQSTTGWHYDHQCHGIHSNWMSPKRIYFNTVSEKLNFASNYPWS